MTEKVYPCSDCKTEKPPEDYYRVAAHQRRNTNDGLSYVCRECAKSKARRWYRDHRDEAIVKQRARNKVAWPKFAYGLSLEQVESMKESQGNRCALCSEILVRPHIDHDHITGKVRGILCIGCNTGLGTFGDSIEGLRKVLAYLKRGGADGTTS